MLLQAIHFTGNHLIRRTLYNSVTKLDKINNFIIINPHSVQTWNQGV